MATIFADAARLPTGWAHDVRIAIGDDGRIAAVRNGDAPAAADTRVAVLLPAPGNLHSHAFQRAMAGMTERRGTGDDDFWSWRTLMYRFLDVLDPGQMQAIAALAYVEMLEAGFAAVGEFHYVHHQPGGKPYDDPAELSLSIFQAARRTGIGLTHLPVLYSYGGAGKQPLAGGQLRFGNGTGQFHTLVERLRSELAALPP
ncbi:MAG: formimidoylglutamate deiminase, partial [Paracoccaceae bacterium]